MRELKQFLRETYPKNEKSAGDRKWWSPVLSSTHPDVRQGKSCSWSNIVSRNVLTTLYTNCSVKVEVDRAGLTKEIFSPDGAVVVQVVRLGQD